MTSTIPAPAQSVPPLDREAYDHFLVTRLAVRITDGASLPGEDWLRSRTQLFEDFCLPSVLGQTTTSFRWLLFVDRGSPAWLVERIAPLLAPHMKIVVVDEAWSPDLVAREVADRADRQWVVISRVDSDDALAKDYIEIVQAALPADVQGLTFLNPLVGAQWSDRGVFRFSHPSNAFMTSIEPKAGTLRTVFLDSHDKVALHGPLLQVRGSGPLWMQGVHGGNLVNGESGWMVQPSVVLTRFAGLPSRSDLSPADLFRGRATGVVQIGRRFVEKPSRARFLPGLVRGAAARLAMQGRAKVTSLRKPGRT